MNTFSVQDEDYCLDPKGILHNTSHNSVQGNFEQPDFGDSCHRI